MKVKSCLQIGYHRSVTHTLSPGWVIQRVYNSNIDNRLVGDNGVTDFVTSDSYIIYVVETEVT